MRHKPPLTIMPTEEHGWGGSHGRLAYSQINRSQEWNYSEYAVNTMGLMPKNYIIVNANEVNINKELKPLKEEVKNLREDLKSKGHTVREKVYRFLDEKERMVGFYNAEGVLISSRPARRDELQKTVFADLRKEGTNE